MKILNNFLMVGWVGAAVMASGLQAEPGNPIPLWKGVAPGEKGDVPEEVAKTGKDGVTRISNVSVPTMTVYHAEKGKRTGAAVLVCPGGGYNILAYNHEGSFVCEWLNGIGVTAVLLKYRVPRREGRPKHEAPLQDAQRALGMMRTHAAEWGVDPERIGVLGFSAGGHLAAMALSNPERSYEKSSTYDGVSCRPDFGILIYPAYLLAGDDPDKLAPELGFHAKSQPVFLSVSTDDKWASSSARLFLELQRLKVPVEMHSFAKGGHGYGITKQKGNPPGTWPELAADWMRTVGVVE